MIDGPALLQPRPRTIRRRADTLAAGALSLAAQQPPLALVRPALDYLMDRCGVAPAGANSLGATGTGAEREVRCLLDEALPREGYELAVQADGIEIRASGRRGFLYAAATLRQWLEVHASPDSDRAVPGVEISDQPDFARRGVLLDISRNKVPKMTTLMQLVDSLADLKINELHLYMEHTFAYPGHEAVWRHASPLTADEIRQLDGYCRLRCIELVPNQNSFGHFHRWLVHEPYRRLAECPEGVEHPFSDRIEPFSLCPIDPAGLDLLRDLYGKLLPNFTSGRFHVGFDETFEIGRGRSQGACAEVGLDGVYLQHLEAVRKLAAEHNRRIEIWADMVIEHKRLLPQLPEDVTLCEWGYEAGHPFREDCALLAASPCEFLVCPGTSSWSSFAGRAHNALTNLREAAAGGLATGASGYLITDWGDRGHLQPLSASYLGFLAGAAFAWNHRAAERCGLEEWALALDRWVLDAPGSALGAVALELADVYRVTGATQKNGTALFHLLMSPDDGLENRRYRGLSVEGLARAEEILDSAKRTLDTTAAERSPEAPEARRTRHELLWTIDALGLACTVARTRLDSPFSELPEQPEATRNMLQSRLDRLVKRREELWRERNRLGGLEDSLHLLGRLGRRLSPA